MYIGCSFGYYLINFYVKYMPGDIFTNQITNSLSEAAANLMPVCMIKFMSAKRGLSMAFFISACACGVVMFASFNKDETFVPIGILGAKAGVSIGFSFLYFASINFFEN